MDRNEYKQDFAKQNYERVIMQVSKQTKAHLQTLAQQQKLPLSRMIIEALEDVYNLDLHTRRG